MSSAALAHPLHQNLAQELEQLQALAELLNEEATALLQRADPSVLASLAQSKLAHFQALQSLAEHRDLWLAGQGYAAGHAGTEQAVGTLPPAVAETWQHLLQAADAAREQNERNGLYIQTQLKFTTEAMTALREAQASTTIYGPKGRQMPSQPSTPTRSHRA